MKKNVMLIALMLVSTFIFAQPKTHHGKPHHDKKRHDRTEYLKKELLLTDEQYAKVKSINETFAKQFMAIRKDTAMSQGKAQTLAKKIRSEQQTQLKGVLNEPQWAKLNEMKHRGPHGGKGDKRPSRGGRPGRGDAQQEHEERG